MPITFIGEESETKDVSGFRDYATNNRAKMQASSGLKGRLLTQKLLTSWRAMSREDRFEWILLAAHKQRSLKENRIVVKKVSKLINNHQRATSRAERVASAGEVFICLTTIEGQRFLHGISAAHFREVVKTKLREFRDAGVDVNTWVQNLNLTI